MSSYYKATRPDRHRRRTAAADPADRRLVDGHLDWPEPGLLDVHDIKQVSATGAGGAGFR